MILLISTFCVKFAQAAELRVDLALDGGFVGRPVSLDLFDKTVTVGWDSASLITSTGMHVSKTEDGGLSMNVDNPEAFASGTRWMISIASQTIDHPAIRVTNLDGVNTTYFATINNGSLTAQIPFQFSMAMTVVSDPNAIQLQSTDGSVPLSLTDQQLTLTLDAGFVGRPVSLDVFNGDATIAWDAKTLIKPTRLTIISTRGGVWSEQASAADGVKLIFEDPTAVSTKGVFSIRHRALRLATNNERADVNIFSNVTSTQKAIFSGTSISYSHAAESEIAFAPVYCSGIMRTGLASWYKYKGCLCAASPDVPKGTKLKVTRQDDPTKSVIVTVNDYGPDRTKHPERVIDLDKVAFSKIGNTRGGVLSVIVEKVQTE